MLGGFIRQLCWFAKIRDEYRVLLNHTSDIKFRPVRHLRDMYLDQILRSFMGPKTILNRRWLPGVWISMPRRSYGVTLPLCRQFVLCRGV